MTCPRCKRPEPCDCDHCFADDLNGVLLRFAEEREARRHNAQAMQAMRAKDEWRDTEPTGRRFVEPREPGKVPVDPDAEQLAAEVGELAGELARGAA